MNKTLFTMAIALWLGISPLARANGPRVPGPDDLVVPVAAIILPVEVANPRHPIYRKARWTIAAACALGVVAVGVTIWQAGSEWHDRAKVREALAASRQEGYEVGFRNGRVMGLLEAFDQQVQPRDEVEEFRTAFLSAHTGAMKSAAQIEKLERDNPAAARILRKALYFTQAEVLAQLISRTQPGEITEVIEGEALLKGTGLPEAIQKEILEKGIFDGVKYWTPKSLKMSPETNELQFEMPADLLEPKEKKEPASLQGVTA